MASSSFFEHLRVFFQSQKGVCGLLYFKNIFFPSVADPFHFLTDPYPFRWITDPDPALDPTNFFFYQIPTFFTFFFYQNYIAPKVDFFLVINELITYMSAK